MHTHFTSEEMDSFGNQDVTISIKEEHEACVDAMLFVNTLVFPMALKAAIELDLFGIIAKAGPNSHISASEIAAQLPTQNPEAASMLDRMLSLFVSHSVLTCSLRTLEDGRVEKLYALTPAAKFLLPENSNECLSQIIALDCHPAPLEVWRNMKDVILEGGGLFKKIHGMSIFQYMNKDPQLNNLFNHSMAGLSKIIMKGILDIYKGYEGLASLVDVGGGTGRCLHMIISKYPSLKGINFDLPHVTQTAPSYPGIEHVGGDMFSGVPTGDAIMIKDTCHNWSDESCIKIIKNCYQVLPSNGKLIIINAVMPEIPDSSKTSIYVTRLDNIMLTQPSGKERTTKEFESLCKNAGFSNFQVVCAAYDIWAVMECYK